MDIEAIQDKGFSLEDSKIILRALTTEWELKHMYVPILGKRVVKDVKKYLTELLECYKDTCLT